VIIQAGCFFKLQKDVRGLYGGEKYAMKATSAELRNMKVCVCVCVRACDTPRCCPASQAGRNAICMAFGASLSGLI
jgi:hypothetical protein